MLIEYLEILPRNYNKNCGKIFQTVSKNSHSLARKSMYIYTQRHPQTLF